MGNVCLGFFPLRKALCVHFILRTKLCDRCKTREEEKTVRFPVQSVRKFLSSMKEGVGGGAGMWVGDFPRANENSR